MTTKPKRKRNVSGVCEDCGGETYESRASKCIDCWRSRPTQGRKKTARKYNLKRKYKLSFEEYDKMLFEQNSRCAICNVHQSELPFSLAVDHDRSCCPGKISCGKCVRGLLCGRCNMALGQLADSPDIARSLIHYLLKYERGER